MKLTVMASVADPLIARRRPERSCRGARERSGIDWDADGLPHDQGEQLFDVRQPKFPAERPAIVQRVPLGERSRRNALLPAEPGGRVGDRLDAGERRRREPPIGRVASARGRGANAADGSGRRHAVQREAGLEVDRAEVVLPCHALPVLVHPGRGHEISRRCAGERRRIDRGVEEDEVDDRRQLQRSGNPPPRLTAERQRRTVRSGQAPLGLVAGHGALPGEPREAVDDDAVDRGVIGGHSSGEIGGNDHPIADHRGRATHTTPPPTPPAPPAPAAPPPVPAAPPPVPAAPPPVPPAAAPAALPPAAEPPSPAPPAAPPPPVPAPAAPPRAGRRGAAAARRAARSGHRSGSTGRITPPGRPPDVDARVAGLP